MFCKNCGAEVADNAAVCVKCGVAISRAPAKPIENHLVGAILVTLFCCLPFGIVAIINASKVNTFLAQGAYDQAQAAADSAKKWIWWSVGIGLVVIVLNVFLQIAAVVL